MPLKRKTPEVVPKAVVPTIIRDFTIEAAGGFSKAVLLANEEKGFTITLTEDGKDGVHKKGTILMCLVSVETPSEKDILSRVLNSIQEECTVTKDDLREILGYIHFTCSDRVPQEKLEEICVFN